MSLQSKLQMEDSPFESRLQAGHPGDEKSLSTCGMV
jgi:hypothetical protein